MATYKLRAPKLLSPGAMRAKAARGELTEREQQYVAALDSWVPGFAGDAALACLEGLGCPIPLRPQSEVPEMVDPTALPNVELGRLYSEFVAYTEYLESAAALAEINAVEAEAYQEQIGASVRLGKSGTVADKRAKTLCDERYLKAEMRSLELRARATLLKARTKGLERSALALSREMTRRGLPNI